ncbi:MAG: hypothetical protein AAFO63_08765, partial [Pseudomonadota bacterium]
MLATGALAAGQENAPAQVSQPHESSDLSDRTLDDLIPQSAAENPEDWAARAAAVGARGRGAGDR